MSRACAKTPSLVKSLAKNRVKLDDAFVDLCYCFENYKEDILASESITEDAFNDLDEEEKSKFQYNDKWMEDIREEYYQLVDDSDSKLDDDAPVDTAKEEKVNLDNEKKVKQDKKLMDSLLSQVEMFTAATTASIDKVANEVRTMEDNSESAARISALQSLLYTLDSKLDGHFNTLVNQCIYLLDDKEVDGN